MEQLGWIKRSLRPGGTLVIEGMGIDSPDPVCLFPKDRYAKAPGVWFLPSLSCLENWLHRAGFRDLKVLHSGPTTHEEQRNSEFCPRPFETLSDFLDPTDNTKTIEGYPAPYRHMISARA
jgi:tRNA (mo5U34)-methyltransferase